MKLLFSLILSIALTSLALADERTCENLSFKMSLGAGSAEYHQIGCEKFHIVFLDHEGTLYSESETVFSQQFSQTDVDDEHETTSNRQRWMWSQNGKVLMHEAVIDSLDKNTKEKSFLTLIEQISFDESGKIKRAVQKLVRTEKADGTVTVEPQSNTKLYERLDP